MCCLACVAWRRRWWKRREAAGMRAEFVATPEEAGEWLARETRDGDVVLLKASRGVKLEKALETWKAKTQWIESLRSVGIRSGLNIQC